MRMFPVAILAGGLATRLRPLTEKIPKALVEVAGKPFIFSQLSYLRSQGVTQVVLCVGHLGHLIKDAVGCGDAFGLDVRYSEDGTSSLGTGGAVKKAIPLLGENFFVLYGDSFLPINFGVIQAAYNENKQTALMTVLRNMSRWDRSNVRFLNENFIEYNKVSPRPDMQYIDYGLSVVPASALLSYSSESVFDLSDFYQDLSFTSRLAGYEVFERFYEIGSISGLKETEAYFSSKERQ